MKFRVWAPAARRVALVQGDARAPLRRAAGGWWDLEAVGGPGTRYRFALDDGEPLADPRSPWQPEGVFGPSAVVDHGAFSWSDDGWQPPPLASGVIYELHVGTFTPDGTFDGAIAKLDQLRALGVTHVEIMPVNEFAGTRGWGYDGVLLYAPYHRYGGPDGLKRLVNACHARGLAVLLDVVYNHFGPEGNVVERFGPYVNERYQTPWGGAVNLDGAGSHEVRRFLCDNAAMWLRDYHCDGLRIDAIHALADMSALPFLEQLAAETRALSAHLGRRLTLVAESDLNDPRPARDVNAGGYGLDALWSDDFHHAMHVTLTGERHGYYADFAPVRDVARALRRGYVYEGQYSPHRDRRHGRPLTLSAGGQQLVASLQNHDQVGNRARGDRLSQSLTPERLRAAAAVLFAAPFVPLIFQGEEWGATTPFPYFCDHPDRALAQAVRDGRRREFQAFGWEPEQIADPQAAATFEGARLDWSEPERDPHRALREWYRRLIALRREEPDLTDGRLDRCRVTYDESAGWLVCARGRITLAVNFGAAPARLAIAPGGDLVAGSGRVALDGATCALDPDSVAIVRHACGG